MTTDKKVQPKIYHITHVDNLGDIVSSGCLLSDAAMIALGGPVVAVGMSEIKRRRMSLPVHCHPGTSVGDYVPFYFCPRSVMLYVIHCANHPDLDYRGGQGPIIHLESDAHAVIRWADASGTPWAFSRTNAGAVYTEFSCRTDELSELDWNAVAATDFRHPDVKEHKQAEFLVHDRFPFDLVDRIGVLSKTTHARVAALTARAPQRPTIEVLPDWYY